MAGQIVADSSERGLGQIVNFLAAQHSGLAYCPLDPRRPDGFQQNAIEILSPALLVDDEQVTALPAGTVLPGGSANILFTSGTTGTPRAILQTDEQLRWFANTGGLAALTSEDRVAHCSSSGFDTYLFEVVRTLLNGATVVVLPRFEDCFQEGVGSVLSGAGITAMLAPATLVNSTAQMNPSAFNSLRLLYSGGSELYARTVCALVGAGFRSSLVNLYGPAEGVVACSGYAIDLAEVNEEWAARRPVVPLGHALPGMTLRVVPEDGAGDQNTENHHTENQNITAPDGADETTGRLVITGDGISAGYLVRSAAGDLRCEPFGEDGRTYRTEDVVTRGPDGCVDFLRRTGGLVKVNGVRTSPAELEANAYAAGAVAASAVVRSGEPILFVQLPPGQDTATFIGGLRQVGMESLVPRVRAVARIPVNVNGKHDASGLLNPEEQATPTTVHRPDDGSPEREVVLEKLVREVEGIYGAPVPAGSDLYDLGFSSLQFAMLLLAITDGDEAALSAEDLLATPDLDELADLLIARR